MTVRQTLRATWVWWAPPLLIVVGIGAAVAVWLAGHDSAIEYAVP